MARAITDALRDLRGGVFVDEASAALAEVVRSVSESGKPGKLTIELSVRRATRGSGAVIVTDRLTAKLPKEDAPETVLWATPEGSLLASDPRQSTLELKVAADPSSGELRVANGKG
jgi:hypothetical protein